MTKTCRELGLHSIATINVQCPLSMRLAVTELAQRELISNSAWVRRLVLAALAAEGIKIDGSRRKTAEAA